MERLKTLMAERELSNYRLAKEIGVTEGAIRKWLKGGNEPRGDNIIKVASFFNVSPAWLRYGDKEYAPTYKDQVMRIAEKIEEYGKRHPEDISRIESLINIYIDGPHPIDKEKEDKEKRRSSWQGFGGGSAHE